MDYRNLRDLKVSAVGLGCMGFSHGYGALPERKESIDLIRYAYDPGCNFLIRQKVTETDTMKN